MSKRRGLPQMSRMRHDAHFVDSLVRADEIPIGRRIAIHLLEANPDQPRTVLGNLDDLRRSIAEKGILEPILVRARQDGKFTIISGERRFRAAFEAGLEEVPCIEMDVTDEELLEIALIENLQRKDLTPLEEAEGFQALQEKHGYTHEEIAESVGKSRVSVTETLALNRLPERIKHVCRRADITSKTFLLELGRLPSEELMAKALESFEKGETSSRNELREMKSLRRSATTPGHTIPSRPAYLLDFIPEDRRYRVSLVLKGRLKEKEEILAAIHDLARRIEAGELDLETAGKFPKPKPKPKVKRTTKATAESE